MAEDAGGREEGKGDCDGKGREVEPEGESIPPTVEPAKATFKFDNTVDPECRRCGRYAETGKHVALVCTHGEEVKGGDVGGHG